MDSRRGQEWFIRVAGRVSFECSILTIRVGTGKSVLDRSRRSNSGRTGESMGVVRAEFHGDEEMVKVLNKMSYNAMKNGKLHHTS